MQVFEQRCATGYNAKALSFVRERKNEFIMGYKRRRYTGVFQYGLFNGV
jgi:hypothetical protein